MKRFYKVIMSKGEPYLLDEEMIRKIMSHQSQIVEFLFGGNPYWINKSHIVQINYDHETTREENRKEQKPNIPENPIGLDEIRKLREKAKTLASNLSITAI